MQAAKQRGVVMNVLAYVHAAREIAHVSDANHGDLIQNDEFARIPDLVQARHSCVAIDLFSHLLGVSLIFLLLLVDLLGPQSVQSGASDMGSSLTYV